MVAALAGVSTVGLFAAAGPVRPGRPESRGKREGDRNDLALAAAARYPRRFAVMGRFPVETPSEGAQLATWRQQPGMLGARLTLHRDPWKSWVGEGGSGRCAG